jgi:hypothetical protein
MTGVASTEVDANAACDDAITEWQHKWQMVVSEWFML